MAVDADSFTTQANVEARVQKTFTSSTKPTAAQLLVFMQNRAAEVQAVLLEAGLVYTVPNGATPFGTPADTDLLTLKTLCGLSNELLAAGDGLAAFDTTDPNNFPEAAKSFWGNGADVLRRIRAFTDARFGSADMKSHTQTGGIAKSDFGAVGHDSEKTQSDIWGLDTRW